MHYYISGKVQGVWFRASTQSEAQKLGLTGWVKNLPDGRVEVLACGTVDQCTQLLTWLKNGPPLAQVTEVIVEEVKPEDFSKFDVR